VATKRFFGFMKPQITNSEVSGDVKILAPPERISLALSRSGQLPFVPVVSVGEEVKTGQPLATTDSKTVIHSPVSGKILGLNPIFAPDGQEMPGVQILCHSEDTWSTYKGIENLRQASAEELIETITLMGIDSPWKSGDAVSSSGETENQLPSSIVVMAVDREPDLAVQRRVLIEQREELTTALAALRRLAGSCDIQIAIPASKASSFEAGFDGATVICVPEDYPNNHWLRILAQVAGTGNITKEAAREAGILVITAEELVALGQALTSGQMPVNKLVTVSGGDLSEPVTVATRLGSPVAYLLEQLGITTQKGDRVIMGGRWQGYAQFDLQAPITPHTDGLTFIPAENVTKLDENTCINCGRCTQVCPVNIQVNLVARFAEFNLVEEAYLRGANACIECGVCAYVCPAARPLVQYLRFAVRSYEESQAQLEIGEEETAQL